MNENHYSDKLNAWVALKYFNLLKLIKIHWLKRLFSTIANNWFFNNISTFTLISLSSRYQLKLKSDSLAVVMMKTEMMSSKNQDRENTSFSTNATWFMNAIRDNRTQKSFSKMIQNFKNLFHQEFMKIKRADKIFAV